MRGVHGRCSRAVFPRDKPQYLSNFLTRSRAFTSLDPGAPYRNFIPNSDMRYQYDLLQNHQNESLYIHGKRLTILEPTRSCHEFIDNPFKLTPFILLALCLAVPLYGKGSFPNTWSSLYLSRPPISLDTGLGLSCPEEVLHAQGKETRRWTIFRQA